jgi:hypothetical protein
VLPPSGYFDRLNLHPRIREIARDLFAEGHPWDAVFAASKALVNYVKERSGRHETTRFSSKPPRLDRSVCKVKGIDTPLNIQLPMFVDVKTIVPCDLLNPFRTITCKRSP